MSRSDHVGRKIDVQPREREIKAGGIRILNDQSNEMSCGIENLLGRQDKPTLSQLGHLSTCAP